MLSASCPLYTCSPYLVRWSTGRLWRTRVLHHDQRLLDTTLEMLHHTRKDYCVPRKLLLVLDSAKAQPPFLCIFPTAVGTFQKESISNYSGVWRRNLGSPASAGSCQPCCLLACGLLPVTGHSSFFPTVDCAWGWPPSYSDPSYAWEKSAQLC